MNIKEEKLKIEKEWEAKQKELEVLLIAVRQLESEMTRLKNIYDYLTELEKTKKNK